MSNNNFMHDYKQTISIKNNIDILEFIVKSSVECYRSDKKHFTSFSKDDLVSSFGRQTTTVNLSCRNYMWRMPFDDIVFWVFRSKRGVSIELVLPSDDLSFEDSRVFLNNNMQKTKNFISYLNEHVNN